MEAWVLILMIGMHNVRGVGLATVPGYATQEECQRVASLWNDRDRLQLAVCLPGPKPR